MKEIVTSINRKCPQCGAPKYLMKRTRCDNELLFTLRCPACGHTGGSSGYWIKHEEVRGALKHLGEPEELFQRVPELN